MVLWKIRHTGSPESVDGITAEAILDGVVDGFWEPTDEVKGPQDNDWVPLEIHPVFGQAMADFEPPRPPEPEDETRLDMNPLIDVALVLLIFYMLTTTYQELRKEFLPPPAQSTDTKGATMTEEQLEKQTIRVTAKLENEATVFRVENEVVTESELESKFKEALAKTGSTKLAMEIDSQVPWKAVIAIQDAASGARITEIIRITRPTQE